MRLKEYLKSNKISPKEFAYKLDINSSSIYKYLVGKGKPSFATLEKIYIATHGKVTPIDFMFTYQENINFLEYLKEKIKNKVVLQKELAIELNLSNSAITKKLKGEITLKLDEEHKIMKLIDKKINKS